MNTETQSATQSNSYDATVSVIGAIFGAAHFIFQSAADLTCHAEAKIVEKISKGEISYQDRMEFRKNTTLINQDKALEQFNQLKAKMKAKQEAMNQEPITA